MKTDNKAQEALKKSIQHWQENYDDPANSSTDARDCALCVEYTLKTGSCSGCPVYESTGLQQCKATPYNNAVDALYAWRDREPEEADRLWLEMKLELLAELDFLKSLVVEEVKSLVVEEVKPYLWIWHEGEEIPNGAIAVRLMDASTGSVALKVVDKHGKRVECGSMFVLSLTRGIDLCGCVGDHLGLPLDEHRCLEVAHPHGTLVLED
jgi:hypothetical protein